MNHNHVASFYADRIRSRDRHPPLAGRADAEVAIVGGGLAGLTVAYRLAAAGVDVVLVEANRLGWGASGRNGGFVSSGYAASVFALEARLGLTAARDLYSLSREGVAFVRGRMGGFGRAEEIGGHGWLKVIRHRKIDVLKQRAARMAADYGVALELWPDERLRDVLVSDRYFAGLHDPEPFHIDPLAYAEALGEAAFGAGARLHECTRATRLSRARLWNVDTVDAAGHRGRIEAEHVVIASSAYGRGLWAAVDRAILPVATYVATTRPLGPQLDDCIRFGGCISDTRRAGDYYRIVGKGPERRLLWGGRITTRRTPPTDLAARLADDIDRVYPQLFAGRGGPRAAFIDRAWLGLMGYTVSRMPIVGCIEGGLWACTAFGGQGLNATAIAGLLVADGIRLGDERWRVFQPFHPGRMDRLFGGPGPVSRAVTQLTYWAMQARDRIDEAASRLPRVPT